MKTEIPTKLNETVSFINEGLLDDNIMDDVRCAVQIERQIGFKYWKLWEDRCKWNSRIVNWNLPNLINCGH